MSNPDELYDTVKKLQREFPDLLSLIPVSTFFSDDMYEVMFSLLNTAQEKIEQAADDLYDEHTKHCDECGFSLAGYDDIFCYECYNSMEAKNYTLTGRIEFLEGKLKNE